MFHKHTLRTYTEEVYRITDAALAPLSRRVYLYKAVAVNESLQEGDQLATVLGRYRIRLPLSLMDIDQRYLLPVLVSEAPRLAVAYPGRPLAFRLTQ